MALSASRPPPDAPAHDLSAADLEALLGELLMRYAEPGFKAELAAVRSAALEPGGAGAMRKNMGEVVLKVQGPALRRYGLPPSAEGVDLMKHAVQRRVAEGHKGIEDLANQGRKILGLPPLPDRSGSAEAVLASKLQDPFWHGAQFGKTQAAASAKEECQRKIAAGQAAGKFSANAAEHLRGVLDSGASVTGVHCLVKIASLGIPLGSLTGDAGEAGVREMTAPSPGEFWQQCVLPNRPAILRGVVDEASFPPLKQLPDFGYLRRRCGGRRVHVKALAHDDQSGRRLFVSDPELRLPFLDYLDCVEAAEKGEQQPPFYLGKVPLRSDLPELAEDVEAAPTCPRRLYGGCFGALIPQGVYTYFGCGRNTTPVHYDAHENLLLCICGSKRLHLYPPSDAPYLYPVNDLSRSAVVPFAGLETLPGELRASYHLAAQARLVEVVLQAGDLLYLPSAWWHCVEGSQERNIILNWWFELHADKRGRA